MSARRTDLIAHLRLSLLRDEGSLTDGQLVARFLDRRDGEDFAMIVRRHGPMVWGVCRRILADHQDTEDAFQAAFLVLVRKARTLRNPESLGNWLYGVAHKTAMKAQVLRAKRRYRESQTDVAAEPGITSDWDQRIDLDDALSRLPERYRTAIVLCDLEERTRAEVSHQFGVPEGTISGWLTRGRAMLAKRLSSHGAPVSTEALTALLGQAPVSAALPPALIAQTLSAAIAAVAVSPQVTALAQGVVNAMIVSKLKLVAAAVLVLAVSGIGIGVLLKDAPPVKPVAKAAPTQQIPAPTPDEPKAKVDAFGDPLPPGALMRLGTKKYRIPSIASVGFRPSGELVVFTNELALNVFPPDGSPNPKITHPAGKKPSSGYPSMSVNAKYAAGQIGLKLTVWDVSGNIATEYMTQDLKSQGTMQFSDDGEWLAIEGQPPDGVNTGMIGLIHLPTKSYREVELPRGIGDEIVFAGNGKSLVTTVSNSLDIYIVDTATAKLRLKFKPPDMQASGMAMSPDGSVVALTSRFPRDDGREIRFYSTADGKELPDWKGPEKAGLIRFTPDGKRLLVSEKGGYMEWDPAAGKRIRDIPGLTTQMRHPVFSTDGKKIATHSDDAVALWDIVTGKAIHPELIDAGHTRKIGTIAISPDGKTIVTGAWYEMRIWSAVDGRLLNSVDAALQDAPIPFLPDSSAFIATGNDGVPVLWDAKTGKAIRRYEHPAEVAKKERSIEPVLSSDGKTLVANSEPNSSGEKWYRMKWDVATGKLLDRAMLEDSKLHRPIDRIMWGCLASPDGAWEYESGTLKNVASKETFELVPERQVVVTPVIFSPANKLLLAGKSIQGRVLGFENAGGSVIVFDLQAKKPIAELETGYVMRMAVSADNSIAATMNRTELIIWDLATNKAVRRIPLVHGGNLRWNAIAFMPDGKRLVTASDDGTALVWDVAGVGRADAPTIPK